MNILILGGGGREHALAWAFAQNPQCDRLWCAPGNAGIAEEATCVALDILDGGKVLAFCAENAIDFVMIGPEAPLAEGVADVLRAGGIATFGPGREAARLEASKAFTKEICVACGAPTAASQTFTDEAAARAYVAAEGAPIVVKADGLAAGKGVTVAGTVAEALEALDAVFREGPGARVVIEEFMAGEEASLFVLADGEELCFLGTAQDHKRAFDGDQGPNTGGMGAYSPAPVMTEAVTQGALERIVRPTLKEMARRGAPYQGVLYAGLMIEDGEPRLVEYNVRFGDPEVQVLAMRLGAQLLDLCLACATGGLGTARANFAADHAMTVVMAAKGYPGDYARGEGIGLAESDDPRVKVFHAGTRTANRGLVSDGGRVLNATARAASLRAARDLAYGALAAVDWPGGFYRSDIGWRALGAPSRWETVPPPLPMPEPVASGFAPVNGIRMYYAVYGSGAPVLLIHGGMNHADIWGGQVAELMLTRQVIVADTRGHGRSTRGEAPLGYALLAEDYLALLDHLGVARTAVVGWSDGAIVGLELAMRHPERVSRLFADAVNATTDGVDLSGLAKPSFAEFAPSVVADYRRLSPTPDAWEAFSREVVAMWKREPAYSQEELQSIAVPTAIVLGDHDEIIRPEHAAWLARTIPRARAVTLRDVSHFALFQDPAGYTRALLDFLDVD